LFCSTTDSGYRVEVVRQGLEEEHVFSADSLPGVEHAVPEDAAAAGCRWPASLRIPVAAEWRSGFYLVRIETDSGERAEAFFVVRASEPKDALLVLSTSTWAAYNDWGGPSYYTGGHCSSLERPLPKGFLERPEPEKLRAAKAAYLPPEEVAGYLEAGYSFWVVSAGWSAWELLFVRWAESLVEGFVDRGGRAAFFSGNTAFWQIRYEDEGRRQISYKLDLEQDPVFGTGREHELSTMWSDPLVGRPENHMTGVSFTRGGYAHLPGAPDGTGGYTVWRPGHWVFDGVEMVAGDVLGADPVVVGYECDGCELALEDGLPVATGRDGTPEDFVVLATAPAHLWTTEEVRAAGLPPTSIGELNWVAERFCGADTPANRERFAYGNAVMGAFSRGRGEVFTTGCTDWAFGLTDPTVSKVTQNVIRRFLG
jgi:hypothetical protein